MYSSAEAFIARMQVIIFCFVLAAFAWLVWRDAVREKPQDATFVFMFPQRTLDGIPSTFASDGRTYHIVGGVYDEDKQEGESGE